jgi:hypothetical protein
MLAHRYWWPSVRHNWYKHKVVAQALASPCTRLAFKICIKMLRCQLEVAATPLTVPGWSFFSLRFLLLAPRGPRYIADLICSNFSPSCTAGIRVPV